MKRLSKALSMALALALALGMFTFSPIKASASDGITEFVTRCYSLALQREPDAQGLSDWVGSIKNGERVGANVVYWFIFSDEYKAQNKTDEEFVNDLYTMFLGRPADQEGYNTWCGLIEQGWKREEIFGGFANSVEFDKLCGGYGITAGYYTTEYPMDQVNAVNLFVERLYKTCLGRLGDQGGQKTWVEGMLNGTFNGIQCATNFIKSPEYENKGLTDEQYVENLYVGFMGREYDEAGKAAWLQLLSDGTMTRDQVFEGFANSTEFNNICAGYGIECGEYKATDVADNGDNGGNQTDVESFFPENPDSITVRTQRIEHESGTIDIYGYDANNKRTKYTLYDAYEGCVWYYYVYGHDANGVENKYIWYWDDGSIAGWGDYEFDANGNNTKVTRYYEDDGSICDWNEYSYDANGNMIKDTYYNSNGIISEETEYDANGRVIKYTDYDYYGELDYWYDCEYITYQGNNFVVHNYHYRDGSTTTWTYAI